MGPIGARPIRAHGGVIRVWPTRANGGPMGLCGPGVGGNYLGLALQVLLDRTIWWHLRCNRIATSSRTTERMLRVARQKIVRMERKIAEGQVTEKKLGVFQKYFR